MKFLPNSLLGRNVLLLFGLIVIGQLLAGLGFRAFVQNPFVDRLAEALADNLIATQTGLRELPAEQRESFVAAFNAYGALRHDPAAAATARPIERRLIREVSDLLAREGLHPLWRHEAGGTLYVQLVIDEQTYWLATAGLQPTQELPPAGLLAWVIGMVLALLGALFIQRLINRPLMQLVEAAQAIGHDDAVPKLPENGPKEIADVCRSFNHMQTRLAEQDKQRALMLAGVSHDLRTPLTKIRLTAEILGEQTGSAYAASLARHCTQIDGIIGQFIDFAGIGSREHVEVTDLNRLISELVHDLDAPFTLKLADTLPSLSIRPRAVRRMLSNLIENALRYARPPYTIITTEESARVVILLQDHGAGIPEERVAELLQPFTRGSEARNEPGGAGLGLAIAQRVARLEHGSLCLSRAQGGGLEVRIELPIHRPLTSASPQK